jgi:SHS family sialic acid transporter-like MFS transporter
MTPAASESTRGKYMALTAALLGWMFDGMEMGLFPQIARPAVRDLSQHLVLSDVVLEGLVGKWMAVATAAFLVGAATGGVLFGWLGDRLGRVRAMTLSVLTYAIFSGLCGFASSPEEIAGLRFLSALGMGGEWSLGVALVMEIWPDKSRAFLAGLIGAAANVGYLLAGLLGMLLTPRIDDVKTFFLDVGLSPELAGTLTAGQGWRIIMMIGALPALLTFLIRLFVPESTRWKHEQSQGATSHWDSRDLFGVVVGAVGAIGIIFLWASDDMPLALQIAGTVVGLVIASVGYLYPVFRYLERASGGEVVDRAITIRRMLLGACLGGVALLGTWASIQWASTWADKLAGNQIPNARGATQFWSALGAVFGTIGGAMLGDWIGRRWAYVALCLLALGSSLLFYQGNTEYGTFFLFTVFLAGGMTAAFYGWLPLYLPELFKTRVRATGQGFSFNFGRIIAAIGVLQTGYLIKDVFKEDYATACSVMSMIYLVGVVIIWLAPETRGKPLPE